MIQVLPQLTDNVTGGQEVTTVSFNSVSPSGAGPRAWYRPLLAGLLSVLIPGVGQWYAGRRRRALFFLGLVGVGYGAILWLATRDRFQLLELLVRAHWLWTLLVGNLFVFLIRLVAAVDAYGLERRRLPVVRRRLWAEVTALALGMTLLAVPHAVVADRGVAALDLLTIQENPLSAEEQAAREEEFEAAGVSEEEQGPTIETTTTIPGPLPHSGPGFTEDGDGWVPPETTTTTLPDIPLAQQLGKSRVTILLAGGDRGQGRDTLRTDVMIVATLNLETNKAALFSVFRHLVGFPLPSDWEDAFIDEAYQVAVRTAEHEGEEPPDRETYEGCNCYPGRINALWLETHNWINTYPTAPDPGMEALSETLSITLGLEIDYYVLVDMAGFVDLVDALGGIDVYAWEVMDVAYSPARPGEDPVSVVIPEPGYYHLNGHQALAYMRNRDVGQDAARMRRARCTIRALAAQADMDRLTLRFPQIVDALTSSTTTNMPLVYLPDLMEALASLDAEDIATAAFAEAYGTEVIVEAGGYIKTVVDPELVQAKVRSVLAAVEEGAAPGESLAAECG